MSATNKLLEEKLQERQVRLGIEAEKEHLKSKNLRDALLKQLKKIHGKIDNKKEKNAEVDAAKVIVKPHLKEIPNYYDLLAPLEEKAKKKRGK